MENSVTQYRISCGFSSSPREKALQYGISALSDQELVTVIIGSGQRDYPVTKIAGSVLKYLDKNEQIPQVAELMHIKGIGMARATLIAAALEYSRRCWLPSRARITNPGEIYPLISHLGDRQQEHFICLSLNGAHEIRKTRVVSVGLVNRTIVHPREVFAGPITDRAAAIVVAHNHPSGSLDISDEDREVTRRLSEAGTILGIPLLDHLIFSADGYCSLLESGDRNLSP